MSAYASINDGGDSLTVMLVNRSLNESMATNVRLINFLADGVFPTRMIDDLPSSETFKSHSSNALKQGTAAVHNGSFTIELPALSITAVQIAGQSTTQVEAPPADFDLALTAYPNPFNPLTTLAVTLPQPGVMAVDVFDLLGRHVRTVYSGFREAGMHTFAFDGHDLSSGVYWVRLSTSGEQRMLKLLLIR